jgi:hypothetical protein
MTTTAKEYIPKLWKALKNENPNLSREDLRQRIERDCLEFWSERTLLEMLPDEAKDTEKQKIGRLGRKIKISAAVSAAPLASNRKEIVMDTAGMPIENNSPSRQYSDGEERLDDNNNGEEHFMLEFSIPTSDIMGIIIKLVMTREVRMWFHVEFNKSTAQVISASIGEKSRRLADSIQIMYDDQPDTHKTNESDIS